MVLAKIYKKYFTINFFRPTKRWNWIFFLLVRFSSDLFFLILFRYSAFYLSILAYIKFLNLLHVLLDAGYPESPRQRYFDIFIL